MELLLSWVAFPLLLMALYSSCGLGVEALARTRLTGALLPAVGFAAIVVAGQFLTLVESTAGLTTPLVVVIALAGLGLATIGRRPLRPPVYLVAGLAVVFAVYAAPIVLSGEATLAGFIKLDDTATWLAFTDQVMANGRDLDGLAPSSYEATLQLNIGDGYPVGVFIPLGVGSELVAEDPAWLIQPYMATLAVLIALAAWSLVGAIVRSPSVRAALMVVAAQPALLFGYYLWGGIKELAAAALIATTAALAGFALARPAEFGRLVPLAVSTAAVVGVLSEGGAFWLIPILVVALVGFGREIPPRRLAARAGGFALGVGLLALPVIIPGGLLPPTSSPLSDDSALGNLFEPLDPLQASGIWPAGDFRLDTVGDWSYPLIALTLGLAAVGVVWAWRRQAHGLLCAIAGAGVGCTALLVFGSPWVDGKALAMATPIVLLAALVGAVGLGTITRPWAGVALAVLVAAGVIWSNVLAYRDVSLAPRDQLAELEEIGAEIGGSGPTLMTEYSPYGVRHFLRAAEPEAVSELRRREIPTRNGHVVPKGLAADTDSLDPEALGVYRTLVLRRSPAQSRPPAAYRLVWRGKFYEAWQRRETAPAPAERLALGSQFDPVEQPSCADVRALARSAGALVAASGQSPLVVQLRDSDYPAAWRVGEDAVLPEGAGSVEAEVSVSRPGDYEAWLGGSVRPAVSLWVDGERVGEVRHQLNNSGQYVGFGTVALAPGSHRIEFRFAGADLHPGSGGRGGPIGPVALSRGEAADSRLVRVPASDFRTLCGREWDWIEAA